MTPLVREWAGVERTFFLDFGRICDLEEACGKVGIGAIYMRLGSHQYHVGYVYHTIRLALVGGGMTATEAAALMRGRFDTRPMVENVEAALDILIALMGGIEPDATKDDTPSDPSVPIKFGEIAANFVKAGITAEQLRRHDYADFVAIIRALRDTGKSSVEPPSEDEYQDMIARLASKNG